MKSKRARWRFIVCFSVLVYALFSGFVNAANDELGCIRGDCENGSGTLVKIAERGKTIYRGEFADGQYHGYGRLTYEDEKTVYKGNWQLGKKSGRGILWDNENNVYMGRWRNDRRNGQGSQFFSVKDWVEDIHGESWLMENAENYTGEFKNDVFYGQGTYRWTDGTKYIGAWAANKKHGSGYFDYGNGIRSERKYEFDVKVFE